ncbi:MAG TPA: hypothetical protein VMF69_02605 [Gemmataceae bacterium]|nr:hypothetical protein [Gemmataceae bacterium]
MSKKKADRKKRGPKGGIKHQPGRGHDAKSGPIKKERYRKKAKKLWQQKQEEARRQWAVWDRLSDDAKKIRIDLKPEMPRPKDED